MSIFGDVTKTLKEALLLSSEVERLSKTVGKLGDEMQLHDRRITTLEAQWNTAMQLYGRQGPPRLN